MSRSSVALPSPVRALSLQRRDGTRQGVGADTTLLAVRQLMAVTPKLSIWSHLLMCPAGGALYIREMPSAKAEKGAASNRARAFGREKWRPELQAFPTPLEERFQLFIALIIRAFRLKPTSVAR